MSVGEVDIDTACASRVRVCMLRRVPSIGAEEVYRADISNRGEESGEILENEWNP